MPAKASRVPRTGRAPAQRVAAPPTQTKTKRLPPAFALAWLHLMPNSVFPIRSRDDMAAKISALLLGRAAQGETHLAGHGLPAGSQSQAKKKRGAR